MPPVMLALLLLASAVQPAPGDAKAAIVRTLDEWHAAAAAADETLYFSFFTEDAVFLGTDPKERWTRDEFRRWAHPFFARGKAWDMKSTARWISMSRDGSTAWFDENVMSKSLGPVRGSGVLVQDRGAWKVAQYNLSVPIPNDRFDAVRKMISPAP